MKIQNYRDQKTLQPTSFIEITKLDVETFIELFKEQKNQFSLKIEMPELTNLLKNTDDLLIEQLGKTQWETEIKKNIKSLQI